jgi:hypothetical protein
VQFFLRKMEWRISVTKKFSAPKMANRISRRDFARHAALAAAGIAALPAASLATAAELSARPPETFPQADEKKLPPASQAEVDAKLDVIFKKYGTRFSGAQKTDLRRLATEGQKPLEAIRAYPIENSDQPATVLKLSAEPAPAQSQSHSSAATPPAKKE